MSKLQIIYCAGILWLFAWANSQGYVFSAYFSGQGVANKSANHYHK